MTNNIKALAEEYSSLDEMNADREITDPGELAQIAKLDAMRKAAAPLAVCTALLESEGETIRADVFLDRFFPGYEKMPMGLRVVTMHLRYLATDGFITFKADGVVGIGRFGWQRDDDENVRMVNPPQVHVTEAGAHLVTTSRLGPKAHSILDEIEQDDASRHLVMTAETSALARSIISEIESEDAPETAVSKALLSKLRGPKS